MGRVNYGNGYYEGDFREGTAIKEGHGTYYWNSGSKYEGNWVNDKQEGFGTYYYKSGDKYVGNWVNDKREGFGTYYWKGGSKYVGNWVNDEQEGSGTHRTPDGRKLVGEWKKGSPISGTVYYLGGDKYVGELKGGKRNGFGTYYWKNGDKYIGEWKDNLSHGKGTHYHNSKIRIEGTFCNNRKHGTIRKYYNDFLYSVQEYDMDNLNGKSIIYFFDNTRLEYTCINGTKQGAFAHYDNNLKIFEGSYKNGLIEGTCFRYNHVIGEVAEEKWHENELVKTVSVKPLKTNFINNFVTLDYSDGRKYVGELVNGKPHGRGTMYFKNHSEQKPNYYVGFFEKGQFSGKGKLYETFFDGKTSCYEGEFKKNYPHGYGTQFYENRNAYACGKFNYGELNGLAELYEFTPGIELVIGKTKDFTPCGKTHFFYTNGEQYMGKCKGFYKHGKGIYYFVNGDILFGKFKNDVLNGKALLNCFEDNSIYKCIYRNGKQISKEKID